MPKTTASAGANKKVVHGRSSVLETRRRTRGRPSLIQAADLTETFLQAAADSFIDKGFAGTSIEAIARASAVAKITIYRRFPNKEALFKEVIQRSLARTRESMRVALQSKTSNAQLRLLELIEGMCTCALEPRTRGLMRMAIAEASRFPELSETIYAATVDSLEPVVQFLDEAHRAGGLIAPDPRQIAMQLSVLASGSASLFFTVQTLSATERRAWASDVMRLVFEGLLPRHEPPVLQTPQKPIGC